jgi:hypothetical protein
MNRLYFCYKTAAGVEANAAPTDIYVAGRTNRVDGEFQRARDKGAEVYAYFNLTERRIERVSALDDEFYMGDRVSAPLWGGGRRGYHDLTLLLDLRVGSAWVAFAVDYMSKVVRSRQYDGFFLDAIGSQYWMSDYKSWPQGEQDEWRAGAVDCVRRIDQMRQAEDATFVLVNNNTWHKAPVAEAYVNGVCIEHATAANETWHANYASRLFGGGKRRRVLVITKDEAETQRWAARPFITHIAQATSYAELQPVNITPTDLRGAEAADTIAALRKQLQFAEAAYEAAIESNAKLAEDNTALAQKLTVLRSRLSEIAVIANLQ